MTREEALAGHRRLWNEIADMIECGVKHQHAIYYKDKALEQLEEKREIRVCVSTYCYSWQTMTI